MDGTDRRPHATLLLICVAVIAFVASAVAQQTSLQLQPISGPAGSTVLATGAGFLKSSCGVSVRFDGPEGAEIGSVAVDANGGFSVSFAIPPNATSGTHTVVAVGLLRVDEFCGGPSGDQARATFTVTASPPARPTIVLDRLEVTPGSMVNVAGAGFCAAATCSKVRILFLGRPGAEDVAVKADGSFEAQARVPGGIPVARDTFVVAVQTDGAGAEINAFGSIRVLNVPSDADEEPDGTADSPAGTPTSSRGFGSGLKRVRPRLATVPTVSDVNPDGLPGEPRFGGRVIGLTISPTNNQISYGASELGGIFRSSTGGQSWSHVDAIPLTLSRDVVIDPQNANLIIATGAYDGRVTNNGGIWRSTDGGATWAKPATSNPGCSTQAWAWGAAIPNDATAHANVFVGTDCGVAISHDSGATWTHVDPCPAAPGSFCGSGGTIYDVEARVVGGNVQVDVCGDEGFFRSADGGAHWSAADTTSPSRTRGVTNGPMNPCHIATAPTNANTVYLANWSGLDANGFCISRLMESTSGGSSGSWVDMQVTASNCRDAWVVTQAALDGDANHYEVYFGDSTHVRHQHCDVTATPRCKVGAANWPTADSGAHSDPADIAFDTSATNGCPQILSTDGGISTSSDCGVTWVDGNRGLHALDIAGGLAGTIDTNHTDLYFGTQDNGLYSSQDGGVSWARQGADMYNIFADHTPPVKVVYRECFGCSDSIANAHLSGTAAFSDPPGTIPATAVATQFGNQRYAFVTSDSAMPPNWTVYVTTNAGGSWTQMGPSPLPGSPGEIRASGPATSPTFYLRLNVLGAWRLFSLSGALDSTATLAPVDTGLSIPWIWAVDPANPASLYVTDLGPRQMMFSTNGGTSWQANAQLTNLVTRGGLYRFVSNLGSQVNAIAFDQNSNRILVGTRTVGELASVCDGGTWFSVIGAEGLPLSRDFFFDETNGAIYAATEGRGIWRIDLPANQAPLCDAGGPYLAECAAPIALDGRRSSDPDCSALTFAWNGAFLGGSASGAMPSVTFPAIGNYTVGLNVSDGTLASTCNAPVAVQDTTRPMIPPDTTIECTSPFGSTLPFGTPTDTCDPNPTVSNDAPPILPFGSTPVMWTATDQSGNTQTGTQIVTVVDSTPPVLSVTLSPTVLWPPNHTLSNIHAAISVSDVCDDAPTVRLVSITSSEPDSGTGPHDVPHDIQGAVFGADDRSFRLRAEHSPGGVRTYTVTYVAEDRHGNTTTVQATVYVPKSGATLISRNHVPANEASTALAINADGGLVAFASYATNLVPHDTNQVRDVFVRARAAGTTERVSVSSSEQQANGASGAPAINGTGQFVAFSSSASNLVPGDGNGKGDVFVRDRAAGTTERVSLVGASGEANGASGAPSISANGRFVAFQSFATNLVGGDSNGASDIFVRDRLTQSTERLCGTVQGDRFSTAPAISADGSVVAFASAATNLVPGDTNRRIDIFTCDRNTGTLERISVGGAGAQADGHSFLPAISEDGRYVAFKSLADNLVPGDYNGLVDVFVRDRVAGTTERISVDRGAGDADDISFPPSISYDGRFVAFGSLATDLVRGDANDVADVFVRDRQTQTTYLVDVNEDGQQADGGTLDVAPAITGDGVQVGFVSLASNLAGPDNGFSDVFVVCNPALPTPP